MPETFDPDGPPEDILDRAVACLRSHTRGDLAFDDHVRPIRYVVLADGSLIAPVMVAMLTSLDTVLYVPDEQEPAMEITATLEQFEETDEGVGPGIDRWLIYHGEPEDVRWARVHVDAARFVGCIVDGEGLSTTNPLAADEPTVCKLANAELTEGLAAVALAFGGTGIESPVLVGVDPFGYDVRGRFEVVRVDAPSRLTSGDDAIATLRSLIERAEAAAVDDGDAAGGEQRSGTPPEPEDR